MSDQELKVGVMRGFTKTCAILALAGGMAIVPAIGSQGAGALGAGQAPIDSQLLGAADARVPLRSAHELVERQVVDLTRS